MSQEPKIPEVKLDREHLYREDTFTDARVGTLRRLTPVDADGREDGSRAVIYEGQASLMTPGGALPLQFRIEAGSLSEALDKFPQAAERAFNETVEELRRLQREQQSSLLVPGRSAPGGMPGGGMTGTGAPGGGKILL